MCVLSDNIYVQYIQIVLVFKDMIVILLFNFNSHAAQSIYFFPSFTSFGIPILNHEFHIMIACLWISEFKLNKMCQVPLIHQQFEH